MKHFLSDMKWYKAKLRLYVLRCNDPKPTIETKDGFLSRDQGVFGMFREGSCWTISHLDEMKVVINHVRHKSVASYIVSQLCYNWDMEDIAKFRSFVKDIQVSAINYTESPGKTPVERFKHNFAYN